MGEKIVYIKNQDGKTLVSHGYCSDDCSRPKAVQLLVCKDVFDSESKMFMADRGYQVKNKLFYEGNFIDSFINVDKFTIELLVWNSDVKDYMLRSSHTGDNESDNLALAKDWARQESCMISL